jgi:Zn-finger nucleic acid-binding protein
MFLPENPIILPMPKFVKCPKCDISWAWRTWYKGSSRTTCSKCKSSVVPMETSETNKIRLIKCPYCQGLQWYIGNKVRTTCTANGCGKKNIMLQVVSSQELGQMITEIWDKLNSEEQQYYLDRIEEYKE